MGSSIMDFLMLAMIGGGAIFVYINRECIMNGSCFGNQPPPGNGNGTVDCTVTPNDPSCTGGDAGNDTDCQTLYHGKCTTECSSGCNGTKCKACQEACNEDCSGGGSSGGSSSGVNCNDGHSCQTRCTNGWCNSWNKCCSKNHTCDKCGSGSSGGGSGSCKSKCKKGLKVARESPCTCTSCGKITCGSSGGGSSGPSCSQLCQSRNCSDYKKKGCSSGSCSGCNCASMCNAGQCGTWRSNCGGTCQFCSRYARALRTRPRYQVPEIRVRLV